MPRRIRTRTVGGSVGIRFPKQVSGFPTEDQRLALGITSSALVYAGKEIIGTVSNTSVLELSARDSAMLLGAGITNVDGSLSKNTNNKAAETIELVKNAVLGALHVGGGLGADQEMLDIVLLKFLQPFLEDPLSIGTEAQFQAAYKYFGDIIADNPDVSTFFPIARDALSVVKKGRSMHVDAQLSDKQVEYIKIRYEQALCEINTLKQKLYEATGVPDGAYGGSLSLVVNQPKPLSYAQAILNPHMAWYQYLHGPGPTDPQLMSSLVDYLKRYPTRSELIAAIHDLLDEKYRTLEKDIATSSSTGNSRPCTSGSKSRSSGSRSSCSASGSRQGSCSASGSGQGSCSASGSGQGDSASGTTSTSCGTISESCSSYYESDGCEKSGMYVLIPGMDIPFKGSTMLVLEGEVDICVTDSGLLHSCPRSDGSQSRKRNRRRRKRRSARSDSSLGGSPVSDADRRERRKKTRKRNQETRPICTFTSSSDSSSEHECRRRTRRRRTRLPVGATLNGMYILPGDLRVKTNKVVAYSCID